MQEGIVAVGIIVADLNYTLAKYPQKGNLAEIYQPSRTPGGLNNVVIDLARLDPNLPIRMSGLIGTDDNGDFIIKSLSEYSNVDTKAIVRRGTTCITHIYTEEVSKERTIFFLAGDSHEFSYNDIDFAYLKGKIFLLEYLLALGTLDEPHPTFGTNAAEVLAKARENGMKTVVDLVSEESDRYLKVVRPTLPYVDCYISNEIEAAGVVGYSLHTNREINDELVFQALHDIKQMGVHEWVVIHHPKACYGMDCKSGEIIKSRSLILPQGYVKGTTGAGDAFAAGIVYALYQNQTLKEALESGKLTAVYALGDEDNNRGIKPFEVMKEEKKFE